MVLMNLLFEDEEACLEDLKRLCINEQGFYLDIDRNEESRESVCFLSNKSSLSTCQQLFSDNPSNSIILIPRFIIDICLYLFIFAIK